MIKIEDYIQKLLFSKDSINVPGLGVFRKKIIPADIHPGDQTFSPRKQIAQFEPVIDETDKSLLLEITKSEHMPNLIAENLIASFVDRVLGEIDANGQTPIAQLGILKRDNTGQLALSANEEFNFDLNTFGLESFQAKYHTTSTKPTGLPRKDIIPPVVNIDEEQKKEENKNVIEEPAEEISKIKEPVIIPTEPKVSKDIENESEKKGKKKTPVLIWLLIFLPIVITIVWAFFNRQMLGDFFYDRDTTPPIVQQEDPIKNEGDINPFIDSLDIASSDSITNENLFKDSTITDDAISSIDSTASDVNDQEVVETPTNNGADHKFYIVSGCYKSENNANKKMNTLINEGYEASIQGKTPGGLHRVCYQGFVSLDEAKLKLKDIHRSGNKGAWVLKLK